MKENILVVVDMQNDFLTGSLANESAVAIIPNIIREIESGVYDRIIFTRDTHHENYLETQEGRKLPIPHCIEGTMGWQVTNSLTFIALAAKATIEFLDKPVFAYGHWDAWLTEHSISHDSTFTFTGTCTDICVESNTASLRGVCPEAEIRCIADCCAAYGLKPDERILNQEAALRVMENRQVEIIR